MATLGLANRRLQPLGHVSGTADMPDARASRKRRFKSCGNDLAASPPRPASAFRHEVPLLRRFNALRGQQSAMGSR
jgi:hypothetical protein